MTTKPDLMAHINDLGRAFDVVVNVAPIAPGDAFAGLTEGGIKIIVIPPVTSPGRYAIALHELGHLLAPLGQVDSVEGSRTYRELGQLATLRDVRLRIEAERAAWEWARAHALIWTSSMSKVRSHGFNSYLRHASRFGVSLQEEWS